MFIDWDMYDGIESCNPTPVERGRKQGAHIALPELGIWIEIFDISNILKDRLIPNASTFRSAW
jgi:hypothetical protein